MADNDKQLQREEEEFNLLREIAEQNGVDPNHIRELLMTEKEYASFLRRSNVYSDIQKKVEFFVTSNERKLKETEAA